MFSVEAGLEWLIKHYNAEAQRKTISDRQPKGNSGRSGFRAQSNLRLEIVKWVLTDTKNKAQAVESTFLVSCHPFELLKLGKYLSYLIYNFRSV